MSANWKADFKQIASTIDTFNFLVGGIGATAVGSVADENRHQGNSEESEFNATLRSWSMPLRSAIRFFGGGVIFVLMDGFIQRLAGYRIPAAAGGITGLCFADASCRKLTFLSSILGLAFFAQVADFAREVLMK